MIAIENEKKHVIVYGARQFMPGVSLQNLTKTEIEELKNSKELSHSIKVLSCSNDYDNIENIKDTHRRSDIIGRTGDLRTLKVWQNASKNPGVFEEIKSQISKITGQ